MILKNLNLINFENNDAIDDFFFFFFFEKTNELGMFECPNLTKFFFQVFNRVKNGTKKCLETQNSANH